MRNWPCNILTGLFEGQVDESWNSDPAFDDSTWAGVTGDGGGTWVLDLTQPGGAITSGDSDAQCTLTVAEGDFVDMINGKLNPQMAFMSGRLKIAGDMGLALKLGSILG